MNRRFPTWKSSAGLPQAFPPFPPEKVPSFSWLETNVFQIPSRSSLYCFSSPPRSTFPGIPRQTAPVLDHIIGKPVFLPVQKDDSARFLNIAGTKKRPRAARSGKVLVSCSFPSEAAQQPLMFSYYDSSKEIPCPNAPWTIQVLAANSEPACIASSMVPPLRSSSKNAVAKESPAPRVSTASTSFGTYG